MKTSRLFRQYSKRIVVEIRYKYSLLYPEPQQAKLIEVLGGTVLTIGRMRRGNRQMRIVISRGALLRSERFRRSLIDDTGYLANDIKHALKIKGGEYERNVVEAFERDEWLKSQGWVVRYIPERWLYENPARVQALVREFIYQ